MAKPRGSGARVRAQGLRMGSGVVARLETEAPDVKFATLETSGAFLPVRVSPKF